MIRRIIEKVEDLFFMYLEIIMFLFLVGVIFGFATLACWIDGNCILPWVE